MHEELAKVIIGKFRKSLPIGMNVKSAILFSMLLMILSCPLFRNIPELVRTLWTWHCKQINISLPCLLWLYCYTLLLYFAHCHFIMVSLLPNRFLKKRTRPDQTSHLTLKPIKPTKSIWTGYFQSLEFKKPNQLTSILQIKPKRA